MAIINELQWVHAFYESNQSALIFWSLIRDSIWYWWEVALISELPIVIYLCFRIDWEFERKKNDIILKIHNC